MFFTCMVCHGELVRLKPDPRHLTEFYLLISAGGALGGIFVGLVAPHVFKTFFEWPIAVSTSCAIAIVVMASTTPVRDILAAVAPARRAAAAVRTLLIPAAIVGFGYIVYWQATGWRPAVDRARNFYGVVSVFEYDQDDPQEHDRQLKHGAITHGQQYLDPVKSHWATTYYSEGSGVGQTIRFFRDRGGPVRVGVVGLGVGTLATYAREGDRYRFYEINPEVLRMARAHFTYLSDCKASPEVEMGDARLSLERELSLKGDENPQFDVLVLDAFSGDSIPAHLLTKEAFEIYLPHIAPGGAIAVHITNRYLYLAPVVSGLAEHFGLKRVRIDTLPDSSNATQHCDWMILTKNQEFLEKVKSMPPKDAQDDFTVPLWTDKYNNLFQILRQGT